MNEKTEDVWAIVELFGHGRIAGKLSEYSIGGANLVRVDVPAIGPDHRNEPVAAHTRAFGASAIYSINFVDEAIARAAAAQIRHMPVQTYGLRDALMTLSTEDQMRLLSAPSPEDFEEELL